MRQVLFSSILSLAALYLLAKNIYYSQKEQSYFSFLGADDEYQLIKFQP